MGAASWHGGSAVGEWEQLVVGWERSGLAFDYRTQQGWHVPGHVDVKPHVFGPGTGLDAYWLR